MKHLMEPEELGKHIMESLENNPVTMRERIEMWWALMSGKEEKFTRLLIEWAAMGYLEDAADD